MGEAIRLIHFSDLHLGVESHGPIDPKTGVSARVKDFLDRLDEVVDYALKSEADVVLFCGDAYKGRNPLPTYEREFALRVKKLAEAGIPVLLVGGNHDLPETPYKASALDIFKALEVPNVYVFRRPEVLKLNTRHGPLQVAVIPYPPRALIRTIMAEKGENVYSLEDEIKSLAERLDPEIPSVLAGHFGVRGAKPSSERDMIFGEEFEVSGSVLLSGPWDYVALGHIHCFQELSRGEYPPIVYSGSLERISFNEEGETKGFVEVQLKKGEASYQFIPVKARPFLTIEADLREEREPEKALLSKLSAYRDRARGAIVRVIVKVREGQRVNEEKVREALGDCFHLAGVRTDFERHTRWHLVAEEPVESIDWRELLRKYFKGKKLPQERIERLIRYAEKLREEVEG